MIKQPSLCENIMYNIKMLWYRCYDYYDNYMYPACSSCGLKKKSN